MQRERGDGKCQSHLFQPFSSEGSQVCLHANRARPSVRSVSSHQHHSPPRVHCSCRFTGRDRGRRGLSPLQMKRGRVSALTDETD